MELLSTFSVPGVDVAESKSTVAVVGGKAFVAAGPQGVQVVCLDDGRIIGSLPIPDLSLFGQASELLGLDPSVVVTNAVTVDEEFVYVSNGEAGVYVASADYNLEDDSCRPVELQTIGKLRLGTLESVNDIEYRDGYLYVAAGRGGLKIIEIEK